MTEYKTRIDLRGVRFGHLLVLGAAPSRVTRHGTYAMWRCLCDCGTEKEIQAKHLRDGRIISCSCHRRDRMITHGRWGKEEYDLWNNMIARCSYPTASMYHRYGGRGIKVCDRWRSFSNFFSDMGLRPGPGYSLDRFPNRDGNYEPGNVRWATRHEQVQNSSNAKLTAAQVLEIRASDAPSSQLAKKYGVKRCAIKNVRARRTWPNIVAAA